MIFMVFSAKQSVYLAWAIQEKSWRLKPKRLGMNVLAYRRRALEKPEGVDKIYCSDNGDSIEEIVRQK